MLLEISALFSEEDGFAPCKCREVLVGGTTGSRCWQSVLALNRSPWRESSPPETPAILPVQLVAGQKSQKFSSFQHDGRQIDAALCPITNSMLLLKSHIGFLCLLFLVAAISPIILIGCTLIVLSYPLLVSFYTNTKPRLLLSHLRSNAFETEPSTVVSRQ